MIAIKGNESLAKLNSAHLVRVLTVSVVKLRYLQSVGSGSDSGGKSELQHGNSLLNEVEEYLTS